jgi:hypothetical protein
LPPSPAETRRLDASTVVPTNAESDTWRPGSAVDYGRREPLNSEGLADFRFGEHSGLKSDIAQGPKGANKRHRLEITELKMSY